MLPPIASAAVAAFVVSLSGADAPARLYGIVTDIDGRQHEGYIRWDRNEASEDDFLDGVKEIPWEHLRLAEELDPEYAALMRSERSLEAFGVRITWDRDDDADPVLERAAIRFAHIHSIEVVDRRRVMVMLRDGSTTELWSGSSDIGPGLRGVIVEGRDGEVELSWRQLRNVAFTEPPASAPPPESRRLHGTVTSADGSTWTGVVSWDRDEALASDVLDGEGVEDGIDHVIPMGEIAEIHRESRRSARVVLRDGSVLVLRGTNDVDRDNRGIEVSGGAVPGRVVLDWDGFASVRFHEPLTSGAPVGRSLRVAGDDRFDGCIAGHGTA